MDNIYCQYLKGQHPAMKTAPYSDALGQYLIEHISQKAWDLWREEQTRLINEYRLQPFKSETKAFLKEKMCIFFRIQVQPIAD
ncbi:MAG: oxidative damage protection protein [Gammaproteobacteria bacterium]|nr:oxidative damage protection protein [Gammaproteobacteria bacterium]